MNEEIAVIVPYNRLELLKKAVESFKDQLFKPAKLVLDNCSTDGSTDWLLQQNDVIVVKTQKNEGASVFYHAIRSAMDYIFKIRQDNLKFIKVLFSAVWQLLFFTPNVVKLSVNKDLKVANYKSYA